MKKVILILVGLVVASTAFTIATFTLTDEGKAMYEMLSNSALKEKVAEVSEDEALIDWMRGANSIKVVDKAGSFWVRKPQDNGGENIVVRTNHNTKTVEMYLKNGNTESSVRTMKFTDAEWQSLMKVGNKIQKKFGTKTVNEVLENL